MRFIFNILKGVVMGIANVIPGVSGGTMAVTMGIYDKMIFAINNLFKKFMKSMKILIPIFIGMGIGIIFSSLIIEKLLDSFPLQTNSVFIGLILGGFPMIIKKVKGKSPKIAGSLCFIFFFALIIVLQLLNSGEGSADVEFTFSNMVLLFVIGIIASATMIVPGVSGSMVLMILGYYETIISNVNAFIKALTKFDIGACLECCVVLIPFGLGVLAGIFAIAKLIEFLFMRFEKETYYAILGLLAASPVAILMNTKIKLHPVTIIASAICAVAGFVIARLLAGEEEQEEKEEKEEQQY